MLQQINKNVHVNARPAPSPEQVPVPVPEQLWQTAPSDESGVRAVTHIRGNLNRRSVPRTPEAIER